MSGYMKTLLILASGMTLPGMAADAPVEVSVAYPVPTQKFQSLTLSGAVSSAHDAQLSPLEAGVVAALLVEVGDTVTAGEPLLRLDDRLAALAKQQAEADVETGRVALNEAQRLLREVETLSEKQLAAKTLLQQRRAEVASVSAALARAEATLALREEVVKRHQLNAPFDGVIYQRNIDLGEWIEPASPALALVSQQDKRLTLEVPQEYYRYFSSLATPITIRPDIGHFSTFEGELTRLVAASGHQGRSFTAHIALPDDTELLVGMSAEAEFKLPDVENKQVWLPANAIKHHPDGGASVFAVNNNQVTRVLVDVIRQQGNAVLLANVREQQLYVTSGVDRLSEDTRVTIVSGPSDND